MMSRAAYIQQTITPTETVSANAHLHGVGYFTGLLLPLLGWLGAYYVPSIVGQPWAKWLVFAGIVGSILLTYLSYIEQKTSEIVVTNNRVIGSVGSALGRRTFDLNLNKVQSITVKQSPLGRMLGYGTVTINHGTGEKIRIPDIDKPVVFQSALLDCIRDHQATAGTMRSAA